MQELVKELCVFFFFFFFGCLLLISKKGEIEFTPESNG